MIRQPFHLVEKSPWPLTGAAGAFTLTVGMSAWFHGYGFMCLFSGLLLVIITMIQWWRDVIRESTFLGHHTSYVVKGLRWGMALFIVSEVMFFFAFFWAFFHSSLAPTPELGCVWPPKGLTPMNPFATPMLNTAILLGSGVMVTWTHHSILASDLEDATRSLIYTIIMALSFTMLQLDEYKNASFTIADSIYGTTFFVATGFHGLHVMIGTVFLSVCLFRLMHHHFSNGHHFGFEAAAWYWHFVDVVWILLYLCIYWWGS